MSTSGRGQVLIPWPNRLQGRLLRVRRPHRTSSRSTSPRRATRSTASFAGPRGRSPSASRAASSLEHTLHPQPGYPFALAVSIEYALAAGWAAQYGRRRRTSAREACPVRGRRPSRTSRAGTADRRRCAAARSRRTACSSPTRTGFRSAPHPSTGRSTTSGSRRPIGGTTLDTAFTGLERDADGLARVELTSIPTRRGGVDALGRRDATAT